MSEHWYKVWWALFLMTLPIGFLAVLIDLWRGVGILALGMLAFARGTYLYQQR